MSITVTPRYIRQMLAYRNLPGPQRVDGPRVVDAGVEYREKFRNKDVWCPHGWLVCPDYWSTPDGVVHGAERCV